VDEAIGAASLWGSEPRVVSSHRTADGWRVVITVADAVGNRWPMAVSVADD
jgi:hypothetical protein